MPQDLVSRSIFAGRRTLILFTLLEPGKGGGQIHYTFTTLSWISYCGTQCSTEKFWKYSLLSSRQLSQLRWRLLEGVGVNVCWRVCFRELPGLGQSMMTFSPWTSGSTRLEGRPETGTFFDIKLSVCNDPSWTSPIKKERNMSFM